MKIAIDPHTHTIASGHAYNSIREMAAAAAAKRIEILGITDHGPALWGACSKYYFMNFHVIDRTPYGVRLLMGVEANIIDNQGNLDLSDDILKDMDIIIASFHKQSFHSGTREENTQAIINAMNKYNLTILGHPDDGKFPLDYEAVVLAAKEKHVLIELNNASLIPNSFRLNGRENSLEILEYCKKHAAEIIMSSDAHTDTDIGNFKIAEELLKEADFPMDLVLNDSKERFATYLQKNKQ
jgi:putative hydrolase